MGDSFDSLFAKRIGAYASTVDDSDWPEVERLARKARSAPRRIRAVVISAAVISMFGLFAAPGWGLGSRIAELFTGKPAPPEVEQIVGDADVGAPAGMAPEIQADQTRELVTLSLLNGKRATLWISPSRSGGLCFYLQRGAPSGGAGCGPSTAPTNNVDWSIRGRGEYDETVLVYGRVPSETSRLILEFSGGATAELSLTSGFFLYEVPAVHHAQGARPAAFTAYDAGGNVIARTELPNQELVFGVYGDSDHP